MGRAGQIVWRVLRGLLALALLLAVLALAAWWGLPRLPPTDAQREAMALMREPPKPEGRNAWAAVWFLNKAVPADLMQALAEADLADWQAFVKRVDLSSQSLTDWRPPSDQRFPPELAFDDSRPPLCESAQAAKPQTGLGQFNCLTAVRADPERYALWLKQRQGLLARIAALDAHGSYRHPDAASAQQLVFMPWPQLTGAPLRQAALQQVQGDSRAASDTICRQVQRMRKLYAGSGDMILHMLLAAQIRNGAQLLGAIWAEDGQQAVSLSPGCEAAQAPLTLEEGTLCADMRGEFMRFSQTVRSEAMRIEWSDPDAPWHERAVDQLARLGFVPETAEALWAELAQQQCFPGFQNRVMRGERDLPSTPFRSFTQLASAGTAGVLAPMSVIAYEPYVPRLQDMNAQLTALRTARWLHQQPSTQELLVNALNAANRDEPLRQLQQAVDARPDSLRLQDRSFTMVADASGVYLQLDLFQKREKATSEQRRWALPLALPRS